jgi:hypothetical protein
MERESYEEEVLTLKDFQDAKTQKSSPVRFIEAGLTKDAVTFKVYSFLIKHFDQAFTGYPIFFLFPDEMEHRLKVFLSASEVGARTADFLEVRPGSQAVISIEKEGSIAQISFLRPDTKEMDMRLLEIPVMGSC